MNTKYLSPILASIAIAFTITPAVTASTNNSNKDIYCRSDSETPMTIAKKADGQELTIFHWKEGALPESLNPQQLCEEVSQKLQDYATEGNHLSSFKTYDLDNIPLICAEANPGYCSLVLFSLDASNTQADSNLLLGEILDDSLKQEEIISVQRGVQFYGYKVNLWSLLGF